MAAAHEPLAADLDGDMRPDLLAAFVAEDAMCNASGTCTAKEGDDCGVKGSPNCCECGLVCGGGKAGDYFARARKCERAPPPVARAWFNRPHKHANKDGASRFAVGPLFGAADLNGSRRDAACAASPPPPSPPPLRLATPHSNAHADLDGDCVADLLVVALPSSADGDACASCANASCELHIWTQRPAAEGKNETRWAAEGAAEEEGHAVFGLPYGAGQLGVADMDGDGRIDLVFPATDAKNRTSLHVWYTVVDSLRRRRRRARRRAKRAAGAGGGLALRRRRRRAAAVERRAVLAPPGCHAPLRPPRVRAAERVAAPHRRRLSPLGQRRRPPPAHALARRFRPRRLRRRPPPARRAAKGRQGRHQ